MQKNILLFVSALMFVCSATANGAPADDDQEELVDSMMTMYLSFAIPEACAQAYPDLRKPVDKFREKFAKQISAGASSSSDAILPKDAQKEISACTRKQSALSKGQCSRFVDLLSASMSPAGSDQQSEKMFVELDALTQKGRQMIAGCAEQKEKQLRKQFR